MFGGFAKVGDDGHGFHLVVLDGKALVIFELVAAKCSCSSEMPCCHLLCGSVGKVCHAPLEQLSQVWLPYQTNGNAIATRRSDVILTWTNGETGSLSFGYNQARGAFLDSLHQMCNVSIDHFDLDDCSSSPPPHTWPSASHSVPSAEATSYILWSSSTSQLTKAPLTFENSHSSAYEAAILTVYSHLAAFEPLQIPRAPIHIQAIQAALVMQLKHAVVMELESNPQGAAWLRFGLNSALTLDWPDLHVLNLIGLGIVDCRYLRYTTALSQLEMAFRLSREIGHKIGALLASVALYDVYKAQGMTKLAYRHLKAAQKFAPAQFKPTLHKHLQGLHEKLQTKASLWQTLSPRPRRSSGNLLASRVFLSASILEDLAFESLIHPVQQPSVVVKVSYNVQYRMPYERRWPLSTFLLHLITRHEDSTFHEDDDDIAAKGCIVGVTHSTHGAEHVISLKETMGAIVDCLPNGFKIILAARPTAHQVVSGMTVSCKLCQQLIPLETVEAHDCFGRR
ncbi:hypothetical protein Ae201684P_014376 [Aphanomyces euteiches]|uniref:Uncharacterized protein n=1 Tax=Aphanomyces euteiches TaxID=100861 RepID=A0A6G0WRH0_9STRA|nr:hypothetical protein Ae201684_012462 [Aphanomyces euteiches]KAH9090578.1 hypothetical protein Ae201684P_014376 [Aphanomyces euteiches]KAH9137673.1 hypothetical protein AeRB84_017711 [Aphanomyces euteiches]